MKLNAMSQINIRRCKCKALRRSLCFNVMMMRARARPVFDISMMRVRARAIKLNLINSMHELNKHPRM
jgi:hypothetical protein